MSICNPVCCAVSVTVPLQPAACVSLCACLCCDAVRGLSLLDARRLFACYRLPGGLAVYTSCAPHLIIGHCTWEGAVQVTDQGLAHLHRLSSIHTLSLAGTRVG